VSATSAAIAPPATVFRGGGRALLVALAVAAAAPTLFALFALLLAWREPATGVWAHLATWVLPGAVRNTLLLATGVAIVAGVLGAVLGGLTALCEFPGRRALEWMLALPLAIPTYVMAFAWVGLMDVGSPLRALAVATTGSAHWVPEVRTVPGAIALLGLALYPYAYLLVRGALHTQGAQLLEAARAAGCTPAEALRRVLLPAARPAIAVGASLAAMDALADFGAVATLGIETLSTAIYRAWFALGSLQAAAQLAGLLLLLVAIALVAERALRRRMRFAATPGRRRQRIVLHGARAALATTGAAIVVALGFGVPALQLVHWAVRAEGFRADVLEPIWTTLVVAGGGALGVALAGGALAAAARVLRGSRAMAALEFVAGLGYAVPGTVLAVGLMTGLLALEYALRRRGVDVAISSTLLALWLALVVRFARVGIGAAESALAQLRGSVLEAAQGLEPSRWRRVARVHLPLLRPGIAVGLLLAFVECAKELPATLMLRPLGWDTLAVKVFNATSEGLWTQAALPALVLVGLSLVPVRLLFRHEL
jgi:iron(III) transport system permease protein